jgi:hypothetical protein
MPLNISDELLGRLEYEGQQIAAGISLSLDD